MREVTNFRSSWILVRAHLAVEVWKTEKLARGSYGKPLVCIQRIEPDPRYATLVVDVGSDVQFQEVGNIRHSRAKAGPHIAHEEGHNPNVASTLEGVDHQTPWQRALDSSRVVGPVEEQ